MTTPRARLTDVMLKVSSIQNATTFWTEGMGLRATSEEETWTLLEDPDSGQRIVLTPMDFGVDWALAFAVANVRDSCVALARLGLATATPIDDIAADATHALLRLPEGPAVLVYRDNGG